METIKYRKRKIAISLLTSITLFLAACQSSQKEENIFQVDNKTEKVINNFKTEGLNGVEYDMYNILSQAELTVINVWEPSCKSCLDDMKALGELGREYAGYGVQVVGIIKGVNAGENEQVLSLITETKADYVHILATAEMNRQMLNPYKDIPVTLFVDKNGNKLGEVYTGPHDKKYWGEQVEKYHSKICIGDHPAECGVG